MYINNSFLPNRKKEIERLKKDGVCCTSFGNIVLYFNHTKSMNAFKKLYRHFLEKKEDWRMEAKQELEPFHESNIQIWKEGAEKHQLEKGLTNMTLEALVRNDEITKQRLSEPWQQFYLYLDEDISRKKLQQLMDFLDTKQDMIQPLLHVVCFTDEFSSDKIEMLKMLQQFTKKKGWQEPVINITILNRLNEFQPKSYWNMECEHRGGWSVDTIVRANQALNATVEKIKNDGLTPVEVVQYLNQYIGSLVYYKKTKSRYHRRSSTYLGAFREKPEFVCAGVVDYADKIVRQLGLPGLTCTPFSVTMFVIDEEQCAQNTQEEGEDLPYWRGYHRLLMYHIDDDAYDFHGDVLSDITVDMIKEDHPLSFGLAFLPMPVLLHMTDRVAKENQEKPNRKGNVWKERVEDQVRENGRIVKFSLPIVENAQNTTITQEMCEKSIFAMCKKTNPDMTLNEIIEYLRSMVKEAHEEQTRRYEKYIVFQSEEVLTSKEWMQQCFSQLEKR